MILKCGIVGLPNVGKSTLFNSILGTNKAEAANYPFCTIEPNSGMVLVPDERLEKLAQIAESKEIIRTKIEFVDIAGLVKGASKGEGLGNKFLAHIREVDAIIYVLRCFEDPDILHVHNHVNPQEDFEIIKLELEFADIQSLEKQIQNLEKNSKKKSEENEKMLAAAIDAMKMLKNQDDLQKLFDNHEEKYVKMLNLLTTKPFMIVCNVAESEINSDDDNTFVKQVKSFADDKEVLTISAKIEEEISSLDPEDKQMFLEDMNMNQSGLDKIIISAYKTLKLQTFFTIGPKEAHAWTIHANTNVRTAAGVIHSDLERGFISADVISCDDYLKFEGEVGCRNAGKLRQEGKDYAVCDGDILNIKFNV